MTITSLRGHFLKLGQLKRSHCHVADLSELCSEHLPRLKGDMQTPERQQLREQVTKSAAGKELFEITSVIACNTAAPRGPSQGQGPVVRKCKYEQTETVLAPKGN